MNSATTIKKTTSLLKKLRQIPLTTTNLIFIIFSFFLVTLLITFYFINNAPSTIESVEKIRIEIIKSLLQVLVVTIIGGTVAALFKAHERNQEQTKIRIQIKLDFIKRIGELYRSAKKSRRLLRSRGIKMSPEVETKVFDNEQIRFYSEEMLKLNDVQLEIEGYKIASQNSLLFENNKQIARHLERMENYLNKIIDQFENGYQSIEKNKKVNFEDFNFLWEFTAHSKNEYLKNELIKKPINSDKDLGVYYCFKKLFSLSYGIILSELK